MDLCLEWNVHSYFMQAPIPHCYQEIHYYSIALLQSLVSNISQISMCRMNLIPLVPGYGKMPSRYWFRREAGRWNNLNVFVSLSKVSEMKTTWFWHGKVSWKKITLSRSTQRPATLQRSTSAFIPALRGSPRVQKLADHRQLIWTNCVKKICTRKQQHKAQTAKGDKHRRCVSLLGRANPPHLLSDGPPDGREEGGVDIWNLQGKAMGPGDQSMGPCAMLQRWILGRSTDHGQQSSPHRVHTCISARKKQRD